MLIRLNKCPLPPPNIELEWEWYFQTFRQDFNLANVWQTFRGQFPNLYLFQLTYWFSDYNLVMIVMMMKMMMVLVVVVIMMMVVVVMVVVVMVVMVMIVMEFTSGGTTGGVRSFLMDCQFKEMLKLQTQLKLSKIKTKSYLNLIYNILNCPNIWI